MEGWEIFSPLLAVTVIFSLLEVETSVAETLRTTYVVCRARYSASGIEGEATCSTAVCPVIWTLTSTQTSGRGETWTFG